MIVRGSFHAFFVGKLWFVESKPSVEEIEEAENMAILHPDTSEIPIWRRRPTRVEHPIKAWRCWNVVKDGDQWYLSSVAAECLWDGPVLRADQPPVDPKVWDAAKKNKALERYQYEDVVHHVFNTAGVHAVKSKEAARRLMLDYNADAFGEISLYGRVAEFELGYRAEVCMVQSIVVRSWRGDHPEPISSKKHTAVAALARRYECEVKVL